MRLEIKRHERIKMQLRLAGTSLAQIARELGVQASTVASVSRGKCRSRRIEDRIAAALSVTPSRLWPDRYADAAATSCSDPCPSGGTDP